MSSTTSPGPRALTAVVTHSTDRAWAPAATPPHGAVHSLQPPTSHTTDTSASRDRDGDGVELAAGLALATADRLFERVDDTDRAPLAEVALVSDTDGDGDSDGDSEGDDDGNGDGDGDTCAADEPEASEFGVTAAAFEAA